MWRALTSDLKEFVATATEDLPLIPGSGLLRAVAADETLQQEQDEAARRMLLQETYTAPLVPEETTTTEEGSDDAELAAFMESFVLADFDDDIARTLEEFPRVQELFSTLVPDTVSETDFWMRFYWRCSAKRIQSEWNQESEAVWPARTFMGVLGGAVQAMSNSILEDDDGVPAVSPYRNEGVESRGGIFGNARPPFVRNTAVDSDEDEQLGWDDDEEDDEDQADDDASEQMVFTDQATEKLKEELKQAIEERDILQQTVHLQSKQIAELSPQTEVNTNEEIETLKMQLFEKESEIAAMKENAADSPAAKIRPSENVTDDIRALEADNADLKAKLQAKSAELKDLLESSTSGTHDASDLQKVLAEKSEVQSKLAATEQALEESKIAQDDMRTTITELEKALSDLKSENESLRMKHQQLLTINDELSLLPEELRMAREDAADAKSRIAALQAELDAETTKEPLLLKTTEPASSPSDETFYTPKGGTASPIAAVKVESSPTPLASSPVVKRESPPIPAKSGAKDGTDEWGDDDW
jgi:hypothetical protein